MGFLCELGTALERVRIFTTKINVIIVIRTIIRRAVFINKLGTDNEGIYKGQDCGYSRHEGSY